MKWTVGQRVGLGYAAILALLAVAAGLGVRALFRTSGTFVEASQKQEEGLVNALGTKSAVFSASTEALRYLLTPEDRFLENWEKSLAEAGRMMATLRATAPDEGTRKQWDEAFDLKRLWEDGCRAAFAARKAGRQEEALRIRNERMKPVRDRLQDLVTRLADLRQSRDRETTRQADEAAARAGWAMVLVTGLALVLGILIATGLTRSITRPLGDTIGTLASASNEILAATSQQAAGTSETAAAVQETSTTVSEVKQTTQMAAHKAQAVAESARKMDQISLDGRRAVEKSLQGTREAKARMETLAERILALSERAQAIGEIMTTVNDLAEQSNLLAVNAAIESGRAGESGKGFAVVASEVKALAAQSKQATAQVRGILGEIQKATQAAVMAAEQGVKASEAGEEVARGAGESIRLLTESIAESTQAAQQILATAQQQVVGMDQVALAMQNIQQSSTQNMTSTRQVERASQDLNELAARLNVLIAGNGSRAHPPAHGGR